MGTNILITRITRNGKRRVIRAQIVGGKNGGSLIIVKVDKPSDLAAVKEVLRRKANLSLRKNERGGLYCPVLSQQALVRYLCQERRIAAIGG